jgi:hypothetical protein
MNRGVSDFFEKFAVGREGAGQKGAGHLAGLTIQSLSMALRRLAWGVASPGLGVLRRLAWGRCGAKSG